MSQFDDDTRVTRLGPAVDGPGDAAVFSGHVHAAWNIGANPNGGYLLALAARALQQCTPAQPDPLSITVHYLRPGLGQPGGRSCLVSGVRRRGRRETAATRAGSP
jgi:hypothetical protein